MADTMAELMPPTCALLLAERFDFSRRQEQAGRMRPMAKTAVVVGTVAFALCVAAWMLAKNLQRTGSNGHRTASASFKIGKTETRSSMSSTSTSSSSDNDCFNSRELWVVIEDEDELSRRVRELLTQQLKELPQVEKVEAVKSDVLPSDGAKGPDLFLNVHLRIIL